MKDEKKKVKKRKQSNLFYDFVKVTGAIPALLWMRPKVIVKGSTKPQKTKGGVLICSNHYGLSDPVMLLCVFWRRRLNSLMAKEMFANKLLTFFFTHVHCIPVDRDNFGVGTFRTVCERLNEEKAVLIFPEGKINDSQEALLGFKTGAIRMAYRTGKPIVPVCLIKPTSKWRRRVAVLGDAIDVRALCGEKPTPDDYRRASEYLHQKELELLEYYNEKKYKKNKNKA
ncbi:MAG: 1-acyl-sn-glycerol-3-phosphate acyltransferase [Clostridia bacterium]|nr:1-acyl-sn-glycerol-3-phosphate acyltransferase [Clostridia bacterium]MBR6773357.1 1-acyl-sn-glycerol-3-phosphate acyltransferase [Clostridia bacterium]